MGPRKKTNYINDFLHWAKLVDVPISPDAAELRKIDSRPALRAAIVAREMGRFDEFHHAAYRARWSEAQDLSDPTVLGDLLSAAGLDAQAAIQRANGDEVDAQLTQQTQLAIDRGVFGVPTIFVGDEMFWGNDRFELVRFYIDGAE